MYYIITSCKYKGNRHDGNENDSTASIKLFQNDKA
ncbi:MAG: hypothetical protein ACJAUV_001435 [Flavobacteriales bacterium]|jgi:hypothetical protein